MINAFQESIYHQTSVHHCISNYHHNFSKAMANEKEQFSKGQQFILLLVPFGREKEDTIANI